MRGLKIAGLALVAVLAVVVLALWVVLGTQAGSRWALGRLPGVSVENFQGHLGGQWRADHLLWQQGSSRVELTAPTFDWAPACLLRMTLCINRLDVSRSACNFHRVPKTAAAPSRCRI